MVSKHAVLRSAVSPDLRDWVDNRLINAHIRIVKPMMLGTFLNAAVIILALLGEIPAIHIVLFGIGTLGAGLHRLWLADGIARGRRQKNPRKMMFAFRMNSWWLGANMGVLLGLWLPVVSPGAQLLLAVSGISQIASAAYTVRTLARSAAVYVLAQALGLAIGLARLGSPAAIGAIVVLFAASGLLIRMAFTARDLFVTRILSDRELADSTRTVKLLLNEYEENGSDWLYEVDAENRLVGVSRRFAQAASGKCSELEGRALQSLFAPGTARDELNGYLAERRPFRDIVLALDGAGVGEPRWWSVSGRPCNAGGPAVMRGVISDITAQRHAENRAHTMTHFDTLTGLPNRALFDRTLASWLDARKDGELVALLLLDVDDFKHINDVHGHPVGDAFLRHFAQRLTACVTDSGLGGIQSHVARLGSDEFAVIVSGSDACDHAVRLAELLVIELAETVYLDSVELTTGVSVGLALAPFHAEFKQQLQSYADIALHAAKGGGRGTWEMFEPGMDAALHERLILARDLRHAVSRGELRLYVQPLVEIATEARTGYEALLRWQHPDRGLIGPDQFIPIAEETGLIVPIGEWVIRTALAEAAGWRDGETIAINLSPVQLSSSNLVPVIVNTLADTGLDPARVEFEITEGVLLHNSEANLLIMRMIQSLGAKIALDDFGTGYASLNYLLTFPFDKIKIDRRFISGLVEREDSRAIVGSVIALANQLGMCTVAEGVEQRDQFDALRDQGCQMVQGWLFGHALPSEDYHPRSERLARRGPPATLAGTRTRHTQAQSRRSRAG